MLNFADYQNRLPYQRRSVDPKIHSAYMQEEQRLENLFRKDALKDLGLEGHVLAEKMFTLAWNDAHANGLHAVYDRLEDLADLFRDVMVQSTPQHQMTPVKRVTLQSGAVTSHPTEIGYHVIQYLRDCDLSYYQGKAGQYVCTDLNSGGYHYSSDTPEFHPNQWYLERHLKTFEGLIKAGVVKIRPVLLG